MENREVKFSVHDKETGVHIGFERIGQHGHWEFLYNHRKEWLRGVITDGQVGKEHIRRQFTGLKDRNGKDIYEGDIIEYLHPNNEVNTSATVIWNHHTCGYDIDNRPDLDWEEILDLDITAIGNIYENPELL